MWRRYSRRSESQRREPERSSERRSSRGVGAHGESSGSPQEVPHGDPFPRPLLSTEPRQHRRSTRHSGRRTVQVILVDTNLLVYARMTTLPQHAAARDWLDGRLNDRPRVGLPWQSLLGFLRIATNSRIFERPDSVSAAWAQVEKWLDCPNVWIPQPSGGAPSDFRTAIDARGGRGESGSRYPFGGVR